MQKMSPAGLDFGVLIAPSALVFVTLSSRVQRGQSVIQQVNEYTLHGKHNWVIVSY